MSAEKREKENAKERASSLLEKLKNKNRRLNERYGRGRVTPPWLEGGQGKNKTCPR